MTEELHDRLSPIGYTPLIAQGLAQLDADGTPMRVIEVHRDSLVLHDGVNERRGQVLPALARAATVPGEQFAVGDWVLARADDPHDLWVTARMAPVTQIARRTSEGARQCLVSNVDTALLTMGLDGDYNLRRLERYLAMVQGAGVWPVVVLTKQDLVASAQDKLQAAIERVPRSVAVLSVDARAPEVVEVLSDYLGVGQTLVLLGSSGAGKSTLTNALMGCEVQATGAVRSGDSRGRHTTTSRSLHCLPGGACVIDTPGLRGLQADVGTEGLDASFADIVALAEQCRFRDCTHADEPDCAVRAQTDPDRLMNYHKLRRELRRESMTFLDRRRQLAEWKARSRGAEQRMKLKRG